MDLNNTFSFLGTSKDHIQTWQERYISFGASLSSFVNAKGIEKFLFTMDEPTIFMSKTSKVALL